MLKFVRWYNLMHKHVCLKFVTPTQRHVSQSARILCQREQVYAAAKSLHPERWAGPTRNWELKDEVWLNPECLESETVR
jgi:hypothetical protein